MMSGCKMNNINVVYTPWANLKKTGDMDVGQIGFHRQRDVSRNEQKTLLAQSFVLSHKLFYTNEWQYHWRTTSGVLSLHCVSGEDRGGGEEDQRDREPPGENKRRTLPWPCGGERVERQRGEEREESSASRAEEEREGRDKEEKRDGGSQVHKMFLNCLVWRTKAAKSKINVSLN